MSQSTWLHVPMHVGSCDSWSGILDAKGVGEVGRQEVTGLIDIKESSIIINNYQNELPERWRNRIYLLFLQQFLIIDADFNCYCLSFRLLLS